MKRMISKMRGGMVGHMKQIRIIQKTGIMLFLMVFLVLSMPVPVYAATGIDMTQLGAITIDFSKAKVTATSINLVIYKVADLLNTGEYKLVTDFVDSGVQLDNLSTASQVAAASKTLVDYTVKNNIQGTLGTIDTSNTLKFDQLALGYYLVMQTTASKDQQNITCNPILLNLPYQYEFTSGTGWLYQVLIYPKIEINNAVITPNPGSVGTSSNTPYSNPSNTGSATLTPSPTGTPNQTEDPGEAGGLEITIPKAGVLPPVVKDGNKADDSKDSDIPVNKKKTSSGDSFNLPKTGGSIAYALCKDAGILLIFSSFILFVASKRKRFEMK